MQPRWSIGVIERLNTDIMRYMYDMFSLQTRLYMDNQFPLKPKIVEVIIRSAFSIYTKVSSHFLLIIISMRRSLPTY